MLIVGSIAEARKYFGITTFYRAVISPERTHVSEYQFQQLIGLRDSALLEITPSEDYKAAELVLNNLERARKTFVKENASDNETKED